MQKDITNPSKNHTDPDLDCLRYSWPSFYPLCTRKRGADFVKIIDSVCHFLISFNEWYLFTVKWPVKRPFKVILGNVFALEDQRCHI